MELTLTACVICRDDRGTQLAKLLIARFREVYVMVSDQMGDRCFSREDEVGSILPRHLLPSAFDAVFFHSGNEDLWLANRHLEARYTFEFNTPGTPALRDGVLPIFRPTAPSFSIKAQDVDEVADYILEQRNRRPAMCFPGLDAIAALSILCQNYLENYHGLQQDAMLRQAQGWRTALGWQEQQNQFQADIEREWISLDRAEIDIVPLVRLVKAIQTDEPSISLEIVHTAYQTIAEKLGYSPDSFLLNPNWKTAATWIFTTAGSWASHAIAVLASTSLQIKMRMLNPTQPLPHLEEIHNSILLLNEHQMSDLIQLRSRHYRGAVLVTSTQPFTILKQKYRVLRFGYGSHATLSLPWTIDELRSQCETLLPLEPENLRLWQLEQRAAASLRNGKMADCLEQLRQLQENAISDQEQRSRRVEKITNALRELQPVAPVAYHTSVMINGEKRQLQQHLHAALQQIDEPKYHEQALAQLAQAFACLEQLLTGTELYSPR